MWNRMQGITHFFNLRQQLGAESSVASGGTHLRQTRCRYTDQLARVLGRRGQQQSAARADEPRHVRGIEAGRLARLL
jgi:hypothetical protein